jgi:hypothetical protein
MRRAASLGSAPREAATASALRRLQCAGDAAVSADPVALSGVEHRHVAIATRG